MCRDTTWNQLPLDLITIAARTCEGSFLSLCSNRIECLLFISREQHSLFPSRLCENEDAIFFRQDVKKIVLPYIHCVRFTSERELFTFFPCHPHPAGSTSSTKTPRCKSDNLSDSCRSDSRLTGQSCLCPACDPLQKKHVKPQAQRHDDVTTNLDSPALGPPFFRLHSPCITFPSFHTQFLGLEFHYYYYWFSHFTPIPNTGNYI